MLTTVFLLDPSPTPNATTSNQRNSPSSLDYQKMVAHSIASRLSQTVHPLTLTGSAPTTFTLLRTHGSEGKYSGKCLTLLQPLDSPSPPPRFTSSLSNLRHSSPPPPPGSLNSSISLALSIQAASISSHHKITPSIHHPLSTSCGRRPLITPSPCYILLNLSSIMSNKLSIRPQSFSSIYNAPLVQWNRLQVIIMTGEEGVGPEEEKIVKGYRELCGAVGGRVWIWKGGNGRKINKLSEALMSSYCVPDFLPSHVLRHILERPNEPLQLGEGKRAALPNITVAIVYEGKKNIVDATFVGQSGGGNGGQNGNGGEDTEEPVFRPPQSSVPIIPFPDTLAGKPKSTYPNLTLLPVSNNSHCLTFLHPLTSLLTALKNLKKGDRRIAYEMYYINELRVPTGIHDVASIVDSVTKINLGVVYKPGNGSGAVLVMGPPCVEALGELTVKALGKSEEFWEKMKGKNSGIRPTPTGKLREDFKAFASLIPPYYADSIRAWAKVMDSAFAEDLTRHLPKVTYENPSARADGERARVFLDEGKKGGEGEYVDYRKVYEEGMKKFFPSACNLSRRVTDNAQFSTVLEGQFEGRSKKISEQGNHRNRKVNESDLLRLNTIGRDGIWEGRYDDDAFPPQFFHPITGQFTDSPEARRMGVNVDFGNPFASREPTIGEVWSSQRKKRKKKIEEAGEEEGVFAFAKVGEEDEKEEVPLPPTSSTTPPVTPKTATQSPPGGGASGGGGTGGQSLTEEQLTDEKNKPSVRLPKDWVLAWSRSNKRWYFYNIPSKKSVWELAHVR
ncbi:hypothetical protein TrVE_jg4755 [Triparma verrucosa]|uniref:WW domain-containing protein n=1 Tax=Triparma verrucosa TaxID=1606542 RepID=A0A9W7F680_9STRA|nr:hypothetical protein TrVE_jg4755 [Triparma verrucosa]